MNEKLTCVYLAGGLSSRFGGKIKGLTCVGENQETLIEISMIQAIESGFNNIVIIGSPKTLPLLKEKFGDSFKDISVKYALQEDPVSREKPYGTTHALLAAKDVVDSKFVVLNGDDIYGKDALKSAANHLNESQDHGIIGYPLEKVVPEQAKVNRGLIKHNEGVLESIEEIIGIARTDIGEKYTGSELMSMNLFALTPSVFDYLEKDFNNFLENLEENSTNECFLPESLSKLIKETSEIIRVVATDSEHLGITHPGDEEKLREKLKLDQ